MIKTLRNLKNKYFPEKKFRAARIWSNVELKKISKLFAGDIINVSGWKDEDKQGGVYREYFSNAASYTVSNFGGERGYQGNEIYIDLEAELPTELCAKYDVVFNHTTLEHVFNMQIAFKNLCEMSKDVVIIVVPFMQEMHFIENSFKDYWRFTPYAITSLFESNGMKTVYMAGDTSKDHSIYLLAVGSKHPQKWKDIVFDPDIFKHFGNNIIR